jgi:hypothetical protein
MDGFIPSAVPIALAAERARLQTIAERFFDDASQERDR